MSRLGLLDPETEAGRIAHEVGIGPATIGVVGPMGSGTRLLTRILEAGGFSAWFDPHHGLIKRPLERVVTTVREMDAALASAMKNHHPDDVIHPSRSVGLIAIHYPNAYVVDYDLLLADPDRVLEDLADWLGVKPWDSPEPIISGGIR